MAADDRIGDSRSHGQEVAEYLNLIVAVMLSAFKPQAIVEFKQRDKSRIESVLAYGE